MEGRKRKEELKDITEGREKEIERRRGEEGREKIINEEEDCKLDKKCSVMKRGKLRNENDKEEQKEEEVNETHEGEKN